MSKQGKLSERKRESVERTDSTFSSVSNSSERKERINVQERERNRDEERKSVFLFLPIRSKRITPYTDA